MPVHLKALVVILLLASAIFALARIPACANAIRPADFDRRRNLWFAITLLAFLAHNYWAYMIIATIVLLYAQRREDNRLALFLFLVLVVPEIQAFVPGPWAIQNLFSVHFQRLLVLAVLLPAFFALWSRPDTERLGSSLPDKLVLGYLVLSVALMYTYSTLTVTLRNGVFNAFVDIFLPYYVATRSLRNLQAFRDALMSFVVAAMALSVVLIFEFSRRWLLYADLNEVLGVAWGWMNYISRGSNLRASGTMSHPIGAGYMVAVALGLYLYARKLVPRSGLRMLGFLLLLGGLVAPISRGPWMGAAAMILVFVATGPMPAVNLAKLALLGAAALPVLLLSPLGDTFINYLPWVGQIEAGNVAFRERLAAAAIQLFLENPLFGRYDYLETPTMEALRGNDGLIDMVNTYAIVGLSSGLAGLSLFVGFFATALLAVHRGMRSVGDRGDERYMLGQGLLATTTGILVIIGTMGPGISCGTIYWTLGGICVAYARLMKVREPASAVAASDRVRPARVMA